MAASGFGVCTSILSHAIVLCSATQSFRSCCAVQGIDDVIGFRFQGDIPSPKPCHRNALSQPWLSFMCMLCCGVQGIEVTIGSDNLITEFNIAQPLMHDLSVAWCGDRTRVEGFEPRAGGFRPGALGIDLGVLSVFPGPWVLNRRSGVLDLGSWVGRMCRIAQGNMDTVPSSP
jgi:hypothetical protein